MLFEEAGLQEALKSRISALVDGGRFPHASIFFGEEEEKLRALARSISAALVCTGGAQKPCGKCSHCIKASRACHPDIIYVRPEKDKTEIKVDQIRAIVRDAVILPNEAERKIYVIEKADSMNSAAQNAFLKLLEEPPGYACFILLAGNPELLLQTVRSRCALFAAERTERGEYSDTDALSREYLEALLSGSEHKAALFSLKIEKLDKKEMAEFTDGTVRYLTSVLRDAALKGQKTEGARRIQEAAGLLMRLRDMQQFNVGQGHLAGMLAAGTAEIILK